MSQRHDPYRQASNLWQALSQDKRPIGFLLGAGCPMSVLVERDGEQVPLIPAVTQLTQAVCEDIRGECGELLKRAETNCAADGCCSPNIEVLLTHIRRLRDAAGADPVRGLSAAELDVLDDAICRAIVKRVDQRLPSQGTPYHSLATWISAVDRMHPIEVFTPNYDLLTEQALEDGRVPYFDGFVGTRRAFLDAPAMADNSLPARWARVWKLHGSVNWRLCGGDVYRAPEGEGEQWVIYPSHLKYEQSRRMPYLAMGDRLRGFLKTPAAVLVICGYSFGDQHLNDVLCQALQANPSAAAFALMYGDLAVYDAAISLGTLRSNLTLLAEDAAVVGTLSGAWRERMSSDDDLSLMSTAVEWRPVGSEGSGLLRAHFLLGDFGRLGGFLRELLGGGVLAEGGLDAD